MDTGAVVNSGDNGVKTPKDATQEKEAQLKEKAAGVATIYMTPLIMSLVVAPLLQLAQLYVNCQKSTEVVQNYIKEEKMLRKARAEKMRFMRKPSPTAEPMPSAAKA